eukprot:976194-Rhodomonas_salina.2
MSPVCVCVSSSECRALGWRQSRTMPMDLVSSWEDAWEKAPGRMRGTRTGQATVPGVSEESHGLRGLRGARGWGVNGCRRCVRWRGRGQERAGDTQRWGA